MRKYDKKSTKTNTKNKNKIKGDPFASEVINIAGGPPPVPNDAFSPREVRLSVGGGAPGGGPPPVPPKYHGIFFFFLVRFFGMHFFFYRHNANKSLCV